jgi:hypothetical protein
MCKMIYLEGVSPMFWKKCFFFLAHGGINFHKYDFNFLSMLTLYPTLAKIMAQLLPMRPDPTIPIFPLDSMLTLSFQISCFSKLLDASWATAEPGLWNKWTQVVRITGPGYEFCQGQGRP